MKMYLRCIHAYMHIRRPERQLQVGKFDDAEALIAAVSAGVSTDDKELSEAAVRSLLQSTRTMIMLERRDLVNRAISPVNFWLRFQNELSSLYESVTDVIVNHVHHLITVQQLGDAVPFFETFSLMVQGRLKRVSLLHSTLVEPLSAWPVSGFLA